ncbi:MAG TPA: hypothetical protein PLG17_06855 [Thermodesulfobacteriota bacterium]|nr:hypothetical protein [Deltaproteobacteria bacterium]HQO78214.1 hypothetical protein [Thermodesulfobacteriota bacterium]
MKGNAEYPHERCDIIGNTVTKPEPANAGAGRISSFDVARVLTKHAGPDQGLFVEVGAGDGLCSSITVSLERKGWTGLLIEAEAEKSAQCMANRPACGVLNYTCIGTESPLASGAGFWNQPPQSQNLSEKARTISSILNEYDIANPDLLVLNVSAAGKTILDGLDTTKHRPAFMIIAGSDEQSIVAPLECGYELLESDVSEQGDLYHLFHASDKLSSQCSEVQPVDLQVASRDRLKGAWDIAARSNASYPGKYVAYYSLNVDGRYFEGERPWEERWSYIGPALREACGGSLDGKKILELGCNLGLLSVWAAREGAQCRGYEYEADILEGCRLVAEEFGVEQQCRWQQADFNRKEMTDAIEDGADVCTCLSVMNWVRNKENLIGLMSRQKVVLYEGHESDEVELKRLAQAGFGSVKKVAVSERGRSVFLARKDGAAKQMSWDEFEKRYDLIGAPFCVPSVSKGDGGEKERIYYKLEVWKARLSKDKNPAKLASPHQEAQYLRQLAGVENVCRLKEYREREDHTISVLEYFPNVGTLDAVPIPPEMRNRVEQQKHRIIQAVNSAGILHNDLFERNFLVGPDYELCLIDFDQAEPAEGRNDYDHGFFYRVPRSVSGNPIHTNNRLEAAWDIAARSNASYPGKYVAYYSLNVDGRYFEGERPWEERWSYIGPALREACGGSLDGKKILELGCNLGLLSVWAAREGAQCRGYEYEADILEGCRLVAEEFGVEQQCRWQQADFNRKEMTDAIEDGADVCTCLSVMNWVRNKENLIGLMSRQKVVLYEGHESDEVELKRLAQAGFGSVKKVAVSERGRSILLGQKYL